MARNGDETGTSSSLSHLLTPKLALLDTVVERNSATSHECPHFRAQSLPRLLSLFLLRLHKASNPYIRVK